MSRMGKIVPLFGDGTYAKSAVVTRQRRLNVYFEQRKDKDKTSVAIYGTPGLVQKWALVTPSSSPVRGMLGLQSALYLVSYNQFQSVSSAGTALFSASLGTIGGLISLAVNAGVTQCVVVDGSNGYLYTPANGTFATLGASFPSGAKTITYCSNFFCAEQPGTQYFWVSNANDGSTWNSLAFSSLSQYSDTILAVDNLLGYLLLFGQTHFEVWQDVGNSPVPFVPVQSATYPYGLAAIFSRAKVDQALIFLGQNAEGQAQVVKLEGFEAVPISDPDIDALINSFSVISDATALSYGVDHHKFYQLNFPTANRSFLYDVTSGIWCEVQTGVSLSPVRHTANLSTYYGGETILADASSNLIYTMSPSAYTDNGTAIMRELVTRHQLSNFDRIRISSLYLDMETGVGLQTGQGSNPQLMVQYSKDNGRTWSAERWASIGEVGRYFTRVILRRFGCTRDAVFRFRMTDPVKFVVTAGALKVKAPATLKKDA